MEARLSGEAPLTSLELFPRPEPKPRVAKKVSKALDMSWEHLRVKACILLTLCCIYTHPGHQSCCMARGNPFLAVVPKFTTVYLTFAFVPRKPAALSLPQLLVLGASCPDGTWYVERSPQGPTPMLPTQTSSVWSQSSHSALCSDRSGLDPAYILIVFLRPNVLMPLLGTDFSRGHVPDASWHWKWGTHLATATLI